MSTWTCSATGSSCTSPPIRRRSTPQRSPTRVPVEQVCVASVTPQPTSPCQPGDTLDVIVMPRADGEVPPDTLVACGGPPFPISALDTAIPLEDSGDPALLRAFDQFMASEEGRFWPAGNWYALVADDDRIELIRPDRRDVGFMTFESSRAGWTWTGGSFAGRPCRLRVVLLDGLGEVRWRLDPSFDRPGPGHHRHTPARHRNRMHQRTADGRPTPRPTGHRDPLRGPHRPRRDPTNRQPRMPQQPSAGRHLDPLRPTRRSTHPRRPRRPHQPCRAPRLTGRPGVEPHPHRGPAIGTAAGWTT
jgi:hypothetical protein